MAAISYATQEINAKIVYYGPGLSGKTTNLKVIYKNVQPEARSNMISLSTEGERTLFFDFLPLDIGRIKGFKIKLQLYTVPGQVYYNATRKLVLRGVDGIVFVADSSPDKAQENIDSYVNLLENIQEYRYKIEEIPMIFQYNKRDVPDALLLEDLHQQINPGNLPWNEAIANQGIGVFESLKLISKCVVDDFNRKYLGNNAARYRYANTPPPQQQQYQTQQQQSNGQPPAQQSPNNPTPGQQRTIHNTPETRDAFGRRQ
jgi:GTPase SAR1 family protein